MRCKLCLFNFVVISPLILLCSPPWNANQVHAFKPIPANARTKALEWKPTMTRTDFDLTPLSIYNSIPVKLLSIKDIREDPRLIGKAYEDKKIRDKFILITSSVSIARWYKTAFEKVSQELGIKCDGKKAKLRLEIEISEFSIFDDFTQTGTASLRVSAHSAQDMLIWEGQIKGSSDLYVHSTGSDGISECLSNTVMIVIYNIFTDQSFRDAVIKSSE